MGQQVSIQTDIYRVAFSLISDNKVLKEAVAITSSGGTREDISRALHMPMDVVGRLFAIYDKDNNNHLDPPEVLNFVKDLNHGTNFIACYHCNEIIPKSCYACEQCQWEFKLCKECEQKDHGHPHELKYLEEPVGHVFASKLRGMPRELGLLKAIEIQRMFEEVDKNGDGKLTLIELTSSPSFKSLVPGMDTNQIQALMHQFDTDHNLSLDPVEFAKCIAVVLGTSNCSECGKKYLLKDMASALTCCKKDHKYIVCRQCFNSGNVHHDCTFFEKLGMFSMSFFGLTVTPKGSSAHECYLEVTNQQQWRKWAPFFEPIILDGHSVFLNPKYHAKQDLLGLENGILGAEKYYVQEVWKEIDNKPVKLLELVCQFISLH
eukprot:TRINITY_DN1350_c0_g1_i1.p1 TRINITY_DN1350_c0_g1~~TRINITY_DN1350_c0_g1_i1.p1  ORF type:complete len:376 (-),score=26.89 TRINITY_DN1350_c0_g1_i1:595-1722(-)